MHRLKDGQKLYKYVKQDKHVTCITIKSYIAKTTYKCLVPGGCTLELDVESWCATPEQALSDKIRHLHWQLRQIDESVKELNKREEDLLAEVNYFYDVEREK